MTDNKSATKFFLDKLEAGDTADFDTKKMEDFLSMIKDVMAIDKEIVGILKEQFADTLMQKSELIEAMKTIENGSVIVYFKSAQLFRIYKKDDIETLLGGQLKTLYRNVGMTYEVIPNSMEQKIIMIGDGSIVNNIDKIKSYIVSFMVDKGIKEIAEKDITCYKDDENVEIIINNYYVKNSIERDIIIKELLGYITQKEKSNKLATKLGTDTYSVVDGAAMVATPIRKEIIGKYVDPDKGLICNTTDCRQIQKNGDIYNIVYHIYNFQNTGDVHVNNVFNMQEKSDKNDNDKMDEFIEHIKNDKPEWYKENEWIEKSVLLDNFKKMFGYIPNPFHPLIKGRLYDDEKRGRGKGGSRPYMALLYKIEDIK
jgi:hypothetical protein